MRKHGMGRIAGAAVLAGSLYGCEQYEYEEGIVKEEFGSLVQRSLERSPPGILSNESVRIGPQRYGVVATTDGGEDYIIGVENDSRRPLFLLEKAIEPNETRIRWPVIRTFDDAGIGIVYSNMIEVLRSED